MIGGISLNTKYELVSAARYYMKGNSADFQKIFALSLDDMYFQMQFIICDDELIRDALCDFYVYLSKSFFMLESADDIANWMNEIVIQKTGEWLRKNRMDMLGAEERGAYNVPVVSDIYLPGKDMPEAEYMLALETAICELPEIHRNTALAFYYDNMPVSHLAETLFLTENVVKTRVSYIEKELVGAMQRYCKEHGYQMKPVTSQKILMALGELQKMYHYPAPEELYEYIKSRGVR